MNAAASNHRYSVHNTHEPNLPDRTNMIGHLQGGGGVCSMPTTSEWT